ncbi:hypothetical protein RND81_04G205600 [Saponaria officinalis]|uniref:BSD domain-containing protein n=1 Tax=Saponaria officinalis TaxID=3572 RepID=A0AAW1LND8_SAPOF
MNFFKSVFSEDTPSSPSSPSQTLISDTSPNSSPTTTPISPFSASPAASLFGGGGGGAWNFGGLIQSLSSKSESVLETYRRDLHEFTAGLKNETQTLKHVAATSLDIGASKAQVSLESVGDVIDSLGAAVSDIIFHGGGDGQGAAEQSLPSPKRDVGVRYSRYEAQLLAIQMDERTYVEENVEDGEREEFEKWKLGFDLGEFSDEVHDLLERRDSVVKAIYDRLVPNVVDSETFWLRYFYRLHRLKKAEFVRAELVKRATAVDDDDEELTWEVDDDNDEDNVVEEESVEKTVEKDEANKDGVSEETAEKGEVSECSKDSDISVVSSQPSLHEEEDFGWDEIEDVGSGDYEKLRELSRVESPKRDELRKRLSTAEDDEDLSWDIEEDDDYEPIKS